MRCRRRVPSSPLLPDFPARRVHLDRHAPAAYRADMDNADLIAQLRAVAASIDALVERTRQLAEENRGLRQQQEQLAGERSQLLAKNEQARMRVEAMIARLKSLEQHT
jgi:cell division protein ZapB